MEEEEKQKELPPREFDETWGRITMSFLQPLNVSSLRKFCLECKGRYIILGSPEKKNHQEMCIIYYMEVAHIVLEAEICSWQTGGPGEPMVQFLSESEGLELGEPTV